MEALNHRKKIVKDLVESIARMTPPDEFSSTQVIIDEKGGHFLLLDLGWQHKQRIYLPFVHIDVMPDGKVWIQHDGTDLRIAELLAEKGIPKKEMVIGFRAPHVRELMDEFAAA